MAVGQDRIRIWSQNNSLFTWIRLFGSFVYFMGFSQVVADVFPEFIEQPKSQVFSHHTPLTVRCSASPEDAQVRWLFNGQPLDERRHPDLQIVDSNLYFHHGQPHGNGGHHSNLGVYRCTATTALGTVISQPAVLSRPGEYFLHHMT
ncbi:hypothetical protein Btru_062961 [Bulinus truncatus]|nr:hypothetical protein Btru_062961 [Bulinus truncatus]